MAPVAANLWYTLALGVAVYVDLALTESQIFPQPAGAPFVPHTGQRTCTSLQHTLQPFQHLNFASVNDALYTVCHFVAFGCNFFFFLLQLSITVQITGHHVKILSSTLSEITVHSAFLLLCSHLSVTFCNFTLFTFHPLIFARCALPLVTLILRTCCDLTSSEISLPGINTF